MRILAAFFFVAALVAAATGNTKLYLKDGTDHLVREYKVEGDRVKFYNIERGDWEELPRELVDLERTVREEKRIEEERKQVAEEERVEREVERQGRTELHRVPLEDGVYWANGDLIVSLKQGETKVKGNKRRSVLKVMSPIPIVSGKATVELEGTQSNFVVNTPAPQFYVRLDKVERFGIARLTIKKDSRIVEDLTIVPITKEVVGEQKEVEIFRQQLAPSVYKIWPVDPLEPGEYAVVQFTPDHQNLQVWDFAYRKP
jgi:hypothetical protein